MKKPLVSVIVGTKNSANTLRACLRSVTKQTYQPIELIVVDNYSSDETRDIAREFTDLVFTKGPERSAQRNFAAKKATGEYLLSIDSDMELSQDVVSACTKAMDDNPAFTGIIIPEESFGTGFWARCKQLERSFYIGIDWIEAARFFERKTFLQVGGYDEALVSGEDWDLSQRIAEMGELGRISALIRHNEGNLKLFRTLRKKAYYAKKFTSYTQSEKPEKSTQASDRNPYVIVAKRYGLFLSKPHKLFRNPLLGVGVLFMKSMEFGYGAFGFWTAKEDQDNA